MFVCVRARSACVFVRVRACLCMREAECVRVQVLVRMQPTIEGARQVLRGYSGYSGYSQRVL